MLPIIIAKENRRYDYYPQPQIKFKSLQSSLLPFLPTAADHSRLPQLSRFAKGLCACSVRRVKTLAK